MHIIWTPQDTGSTATTVAICAGACWFAWQGLFRKRTQVDLDCKFHRFDGDPSVILVEILVLFENKGYVRQFIGKFEPRITTLDRHKFDGRKLGDHDGTVAEFTCKVAVDNLVCRPPKRYFDIRPGLKQMISQTVIISSELELIRISIDFTRNWFADSLWTGHCKRVFKVEKTNPKAA
jgi:hypothetical protein